MKSIRLLMAVLATLVVGSTGIALAAQGESEPEDASAVAAELSEAPQEDPGTELASKRTATSDTFRLSDGSLETRVYESPVNYRAEGEWQPIGEGLEELPGGALSNGPNRFDLSLPAKMGAGAVVMHTADQWLASELLGGDTEVAEVSGNTATYADEGTTFELSSIATGVKESIELDDPSEPGSFRFELRASEDLKPSLEQDGSVVFRDERTDQVVASLPAPTISDSSPQAAPDPGAIRYTLEDLPGGNWALAVKADREWLDSSARVWPVTIDPSIEAKAPASLDCQYFVREPSGETNSTSTCGSTGASSLKAEYATSGGTTSRYRSALTFNTSGIPSTAWVSSASVNLYDPQVATGVGAVQLRRATKSWTNEVNWTFYARHKAPQQFWTVPGGDFTGEGSEVSTATRGTAAGWWQFNGLEPIVSGWLEGTIANQGLIVKLADESPCGSSCTHGTFNFSSSSSSPESNRPYLALVYYPKAPSTSQVSAPTEGTVTARRLKLKAAWSVAGVTGISYQYREGKTGYFKTVPAELVRDASGNPVSWPLPLSGVKESPALYFDAAHATSTLQSKGGPIQVRALFEGPTGVAGYSAPVEATVNRFLGSPKDATAQVGPGTVDLLTGNLSVERTDVSIPTFNSSLEFSRTHNSRDAGSSGDTTVLGRGWKPGVPVEEAGGSAWKNVRLVTFTEMIEGESYSFDYAIVTGLEGGELAFEKRGGIYETPPEAAGWRLSTEGSTKLVLADPSGSRTTFENSSGGTEYLPVSVSQTGGAKNTTTMVYNIVGGNRRLSMVIAPSQQDLTCNQEDATWQKGCKALEFTYAPASNWGAPGSYGDRLSKITYYAPYNGGPWEVANYKYNSEGRLTAEWDPRISSPHVLEETYTYEAGGQLKTITPPGEEPWTLEYGAIDGEEANGRLMAVKRPEPARQSLDRADDDRLRRADQRQRRAL